MRRELDTVSRLVVNHACVQASLTQLFGSVTQLFGRCHVLRQALVRRPAPSKRMRGWMMKAMPSCSTRAASAWKSSTARARPKCGTCRAVDVSLRVPAMRGTKTPEHGLCKAMMCVAIRMSHDFDGRIHSSVVESNGNLLCFCSHRHRVTVDPVGARLRAVRLHQVTHQLQRAKTRSRRCMPRCQHAARVQPSARAVLCPTVGVGCCSGSMRANPHF